MAECQHNLRDTLKRIIQVIKDHFLNAELVELAKEPKRNRDVFLQKQSNIDMGYIF